MGGEGGLNDTTIGIRQKLVDEFAYDDWYVPSLTLALRGIIAGGYNEDGFPTAPGDGAHGFEYSLLFGNLIGDSGFGFLGEVGMRLREGPVPNDFFVRSGVFQTILEVATISAEFKHEEALSGIDLGTPEFSPDRARELKQINDTFEFGLGVVEPTTDIYVGLFYGVAVNGRNSGKKDIWGLSLSSPF